ncbi:hypothetical protein AB0N61_00355 [Microbacterium sp. NPDC089320]|uniref:hypothetical protein n=1 Tax=Microbacterium sp. NPDC089320 TaxID=3155182 RepID=UPI00344802F9
MAFRPANPHSSDYAAPFPEWIISAIPGAAEKDAAVAAASEALDKAATKDATARAKLAELGGPDGPAAHVKRAAWDVAEDTARAAAAALGPARTAVARAARARFEFVYDAMDEDPFISQVEPLFAEASRRAREHLDALTSALSERDYFLGVLGRSLDVDGGNWGLREALHNVAAYVDAGLVDEEDAAWKIVDDTINASTLLRSTRIEVVSACVAVRDNDAIPASQKESQYRAILDRHGLTSRVVR